MVVVGGVVAIPEPDVAGGLRILVASLRSSIAIAYIKAPIPRMATTITIPHVIIDAPPRL